MPTYAEDGLSPAEKYATSICQPLSCEHAGCYKRCMSRRYGSLLFCFYVHARTHARTNFPFHSTFNSEKYNKECKPMMAIWQACYDEKKKDFAEGRLQTEKEGSCKA